MSVPVDLADIRAAIERQIGWCYLLTVSETVQARVLAVVPDVHDDGTLSFDVGRSTGANVAARSSVTLLFPPADAAAMSLIVDGDATIDGDRVVLTPTWAVMHRSAVRPARDGA